MSAHEDLMRKLASEAKAAPVADVPGESHDDLMKRLAEGSNQPVVGQTDSGVPKSQADDQVEPESQYHDEGTISDMFDYVPNIGEAFVHGLAQKPGFIGDPKSAFKYALQAAEKKRRTHASQIMDQLAKNDHSGQQPGVGLINWDRLATGRDTHGLEDFVKGTEGGGYQDLGKDLAEYGRIGVDKAREALIGGGADPLNFVGAEMLHLPGMKAIKANPVAGALASGPGRQVVRAGMGAAAGFGSTKTDDSTAEKIAKTVGGAALALGVPHVAPHVMQAVGHWGQDSMDGIAKWLKGAHFEGYGKNSQLAKQAEEKIAKASADIMGSYGEATAGLEPSVVNRAKSIMADVKTESNRLVKSLEEKYPKTKRAAGFAQRARDAATMHLQKTGFIDQKLAGETADVVHAYRQLEAHNNRMVEYVNKNLFGHADGKWKVLNGRATGLAKMPYHVEDLHIRTAADKAMDALDRIKNSEISGPLRGSRSLTRAKTFEDLGHVKSYEVYTEKLARNFAAPAERDAQMWMSRYRQAQYAGKPQEAVAALGALYDGVTNFFKKSALFTGFNWLRNHYYEDMKKSFMTNGAVGFFDAATAGRFYRDTQHDLKLINKGDLFTPMKTKFARDAYKYGVIDPRKSWVLEDAEKELSSGVTALRYGEEGAQKVEGRLQEAKGGSKVVGGIKKASAIAVNPLNVIGKHGILPMGVALEQSVRLSNFTRNMEALLSSPAALVHFGAEDAGAVKGILGNEKALAKAGVDLDLLKKYAAKLTNDTFFNYRDVNQFEEQVMKRLMPFYTFHKNNVRLYTSVLTDPLAMARVASSRQITRPSDQVAMTEKEAQSLPEYVRGSNPSLTKRNKDGSLDLRYEPNDTFNEAMRTYSETVNPKGENVFEQNLHPLLKWAYERATGKNTFTGHEANPSETRNGMLPLFGGHGYSNMAEKRQLDKISDPKIRAALEMALGVYGDQFSKNGYPMATDDTANAIDSLESNLSPKQGINQLLEIIGNSHLQPMSKALFGDIPGSPRNSAMETLGNIVGPYKTKHLSEYEQFMNREGSKFDQMKKKRLLKNLEKMNKRREEDFGR